MKLFQFGKQRAKAKGFQQAESSSSAISFMLESILTPSAGIDGGDGAPDLAVFRADDHGLHPHDLTDIPLVSSEGSDCFSSHPGVNHSGDAVHVPLSPADHAKQAPDLDIPHIPQTPDFT